MNQFHLIAFDISSNIHRTFSKAREDASSSNARHFIGEIPIYCIENTVRQVFKEIKEVERLRGKATHVVIVADADGKNFRHELFDGYKANRPPKEQDFLTQEKILHKALINCGFYHIMKSGVEADDVLATIAAKCSGRSVRTTLMSRDKDLFQVVDGSVNIYSGADKKLYDRAGVFESKSVDASKISDYLSLIGDKADNIAGVKGFGAKTASVLLSQCSLDELIGCPEIILSSGVRGSKGLYEAFCSSQESLALSRSLTALKSDVDLSCFLSDFRWQKKFVDIPAVIDKSVMELVQEGVI